VISKNDKNKQLTLLSLCKLALTLRNTLCRYKIIGAPKKYKKNCPVLFLGLKLTTHVIIHANLPNLSRETVPLTLAFLFRRTRIEHLSSTSLRNTSPYSFCSSVLRVSLFSFHPLPPPHVIYDLKSHVSYDLKTHGCISPFNLPRSFLCFTR
jgi:hypothetical protein